MTTLREAAQQALEAMDCPGKAKTADEQAAITALRAALAEPPVDDPHRDHWVAIAEAAQKIAASKECGLAEVKALCAALDRLTDAALAEPVQEPVHEHEKWCASVTQLLLCDPPRKAPCNCKPTAPPQRKPLTEDEVEHLLSTHERNYDMVNFARAIERSHGIK